MDACLTVLDKLERKIGGFTLTLEHLQAGAKYYLDTGEDISDESFEKARRADAILLGAMGLPDVRFPDGTEIAPHLTMRNEYDLFAGVRPVKSYPNVPSPLSDPRGKEIDIVILRECTEGLFASRGKGEVIEDREARDTMVITRSNCERFFDYGFKLAQERKEKGGKGMATCVDKSNVFRSYAFFRKTFTERAAVFPDITPTYQYVDAMALDLVRRPWEYDVLVAENMFADILSDLGGGIIGGMGMAPCAEIGENHGLFQPSHGSAPDIAGTGKANPTAMILSAAMMMDWLGSRHNLDACKTAARELEATVVKGFETRKIQPMEFGGPHGTIDVMEAVIEMMAE
jgi:3-isopropylmalate dehydrogenase